MKRALKSIQVFAKDIFSPKFLWAFAGVFLLAHCGSYVASELKPFIDGDKAATQVEWAGLAVHAFGFFAGFVLSVRLARKVFRPQTRWLHSDVPEQRSTLVLFLSELTAKRKGGDGAVEQDGLPDHPLRLVGKLEEDLATLARKKKSDEKAETRPSFYKWEQPLRAIHHHVERSGPLKNVIIVCSLQSLRQVHLLRDNVLSMYRGDLNEVSIRLLTRKGRKSVLEPLSEFDQTNESVAGWDFENFDSLSDSLFSALRKLRREGIRDRDIMIDFTGGMKVTSVVAAAVTFNTDIETQYVATMKRVDETDGEYHYDVKGYDLVLSYVEGAG